MDDARRVRKEQNETLFHESQDLAEERVQKVRTDFVCECDDPSCMKMIAMTFAEYEAIRAEPNRYAVAPGHERDDRVVESNDRYVVVERPA